MNHLKLFLLILPSYVIYSVCFVFEAEKSANQKCQIFDKIFKVSAEGTCVDINECDGYARYLLKSNQTPQICGFNKSSPSICCLPYVPPPPPVGYKSIRKCFTYFHESKKVFAIDLGTKAHPREFGHMVAIGYTDQNDQISWLCGGSLISNEFVISAAHCAYSKDYGPAKWLRVGDLDLNDTAEDANPEDIRIAQIIIHPDYKIPSHYNDIALFKLEKIVYFGVYTKPICLNTKNDAYFDPLQIIGWGRVGYLGETSSHLMKANVSIVPHESCARRYASVSKRRLSDGIRQDQQICAGDAEGRDSCPGDSGGPLHFHVPEDPVTRVLEHFVLVGITSFGKGCGGPDSAGVYTRVSSYIEWIENIVWPINDSPL